MSAFVGWIDLSEEDQKRARDYLRSLSEGTVDELGFGIIRDTFADLFFPATSTIMTRARYFTLVPAIYQRVLSDGLTGKTADKRCLELEKKLRTLFRHNGAMQASQKEEVVRYPASIYWGSLRRLQIYQRSGSQAHYFATLKGFLDHQKTMQDDDENTHTEDSIGELWDPEFIRLYENRALPAPNKTGDFPEDTDLELTRIEAKYLCAKFVGDADSTIISHLLRQKTFSPFTYPWQCAYPEELDREVRHAERFSMLSKLATLVYYQMLIKLQKTHDCGSSTSDISDSIQLWLDTCRSEIADWDVDDFLALAADKQCLRGDDSTFVTAFRATIGRSRSAKHLLGKDSAQRLIERREKDKRPHKRRLRPGRFMREWNLPTSVDENYYNDHYHVRYQLDYRGRIASKIVSDIFVGLEN